MNASMEHQRRADGALCAAAGMEWTDTTDRGPAQSRWRGILKESSRSGGARSAGVRRGERWAQR